MQSSLIIICLLAVSVQFTTSTHHVIQHPVPVFKAIKFDFVKEAVLKAAAVISGAQFIGSKLAVASKVPFFKAPVIKPVGKSVPVIVKSVSVPVFVPPPAPKSAVSEFKSIPVIVKPIPAPQIVYQQVAIPQYKSVPVIVKPVPAPKVVYEKAAVPEFKSDHQGKSSYSQSSYGKSC